MKFSQKTKISTPKMAEMQAWYQRLFGMVVVEEWDEGGDKGVILAFADGQNEALLEIYDTDTVHDFSGLSLQYKAEPLDDFIKGLPEDIEPEDLKDRPWGARYLYLRDPLGIQVIVYEGCW
jgi:catechol 2,3-dioxygenase-like lactoylglutathione lyase family enzyme